VGQTVTQGIISATGRRDFIDLSEIVGFIQTDAAINQGSSGGALIDAYGNLIGINTAVLENDGSVGVGFATPSDVAVTVLNEIVENGRVVRGWVGFEAGQITPEAAGELGLPNNRAMYVTYLTPGGPAHSAGMEIGDIITGINGRPYANIDQAQQQILDTTPGENLNFDVERDGTPLQITVQAGTRPGQ